MSMTTDGCYRYNVKQYSKLLKEMGVKSFVRSDLFTVGGYPWKIYFYPHGNSKDAKYISVYLSLEIIDNKTVNASFELTLLDQSGKGVHKVYTCYNKLFTKISIWGGKRLMSKKRLEASDYLRNDSLSFCCNVWVPSRIGKFSIIQPPSEIEKDFKNLLDSETGSDIVFRVKDDTFKAHKVILAARSPVFKAQFYGLVGDRALDEVELMDIEPVVFKAMILFIYTDKLPDSYESMGSMSHMIQHLLVAADRFGLDRLKQLCEVKLCEDLNVDVVGSTLSLAHDHHCSQLKACSMDFAVANLRAVVKTEGFKYIEKTCPLLLSELLQKLAL